MSRKFLQTGLSVRVLSVLLGYFIQSNIQAYIQGGRVLLKTSERLAANGYHSERHSLQTADGYVLQITRITKPPPYRIRAMPEHRPVVLFGHGMVCSADTWIISDPDVTLAYIMADLGYDVWLGNFRGNRYASKHVSLTPSMPDFWHYTIDELGRYDVTAMIDYALNATGRPDLHYVCHSFGCTALLVAMSTRPSYNRKLRTSHHLSPLAFVNSSKVPFKELDMFAFPHASAIGSFLTGREVLGHGFFWNWLCQWGCDENGPTHRICDILLTIVGGGWNLTSTLLADFCATHPSGTSTNVMLHFMQLRKVGHFQAFDYGTDSNRRVYKQFSPPVYDISQVSSPVHIYYGNGDHLSQPAGNELLAQMLPNASLHLVHNFNHYDFLWGEQARAMIYEPIVRTIQQYENEQQKL